MTIDALNDYLKGLNMGIDTFERYIENAEEGDLKNILQGIQMDYKNSATRVSERIQDLNGTPVSGVGVLGKTAEFISSIKNSANGSTEGLSEQAHDACQFAYKAGSELLEKNPDMDLTSYRMLMEMTEMENVHINQLANYISGSSSSSTY